MKKCDECGNSKTEYNEQMGETCCLECGLVIITEMFEETVRIVDNGVAVVSSDNGQLGSVITGKGSYKFNRFGKTNMFPRKVTDGFFHCKMVLAAVAPQMNLKQRVEELYLHFLNKGIFGKTTYEARATAVVYYALLENGTQHTIKEVGKEFPDSIKSAKKLIRKIKKMVHPTILRKTISEKTNTSERLIYGETTKILNLIGYKTASQLKGKQLW